MADGHEGSALVSFEELCSILSDEELSAFGLFSPRLQRPEQLRAPPQPCFAFFDVATTELPALSSAA
jgi:hypothetical protein